MELNGNLYPAGGYFFIEADGTKITGPSWAAVKRNVGLYRERRGLSKGDVHSDVVAQACIRNPDLCHRAGGKLSSPSARKAPSLKAKVFEWMAKQSRTARQSPLDYVSDAEARRRAAVCRVCPKQKSVSHLCSTCTASREALRESILAGRKTAAADLEACSVLALDLRTAVHLAEAPVSDPELPQSCWRRAV